MKDDSFDNLVLTSSTINGDKGNIYPLPEDVQKNNIDLWKSLKSQGLMSDKKYERLTRQTSFTDKELKDFISRQKTTLDWINKEVANIFKIRYDKKGVSNFIIYSKSRHVSEFRNEFKFYKIRELNNFHHAHDAYLNIVLGKVLENNLYYQEDKEDKFTTYDYLSIFKLKLNNDIEYIRRILEYNDILITKKTEIKNTGAYWDQKIVSFKKGDNLTPIKNGLDISKYGGYNKASTAFFTILKDKKGKKKIIPINIVDCNKFYDEGRFNEEKYNNFIDKEYKNYEIIVPILPINAKVLLDGVPMRIAGKS
ncbi:MAG: Cas9 endonuclease PAM-interacting domain-containing protein, partial [Erysipelotrichales bacterium]|nr:Cas9 endonuclease PAM-interacting domain-containing protein [Erysipelotrichales bacterium]